MKSKAEIYLQADASTLKLAELRKGIEALGG